MTRILKLVILLSIATNAFTQSDYFKVVDRIREAPLKDLSDSSAQQYLINGARHGGVLLFDTDIHNAMDPNTLDTNFNDWNLSARASLLLSYARFATNRKPIKFTGVPDELASSMNAYAYEERLRIQRIVRSGDYKTKWAPFVAAYRQLVSASEAALPKGDTLGADIKTLQTTAKLARELGLFRLVRELPIDPELVASEIFRLRHRAYESRGLPDNASESDAALLYACGSNPPVVHVNSWHRLAPAYFRAFEAAEAHTADAQASLVLTTFERVGVDLSRWAEQHPNATSADRDRELFRIATDRGLFSLLIEKERP